MDTFWPTIAFIGVDLPAFGAPISVAKPARVFLFTDFIMRLSITFYHEQNDEGTDARLLFQLVCGYYPRPYIALLLLC